MPPAPHLAGGDLVTGVAGEAGVEHLLHVLVRLEELDDGPGVRAVLLHAQGERLQPTQDEPAVEGAWDGAERLLKERQPLGDRRVVRGGEAADQGRSGRRGTSSKSGRRCRRRARAAAGGTAWQMCCPRPRERRPHAPPPLPPGCRRCSALGSSASRSRRGVFARQGGRQGWWTSPATSRTRTRSPSARTPARTSGDAAVDVVHRHDALTRRDEMHDRRRRAEPGRERDAGRHPPARRGTWSAVRVGLATRE